MTTLNSKNMAKYRHRIFEMYEHRDEAIDALGRKATSSATAASAPESTNFRHLLVSQCAGITLVQFNDLTDLNNDDARQIREDFAELANMLEINSKVVVDFSGVVASSSSCNHELHQFSKKLQMKGSRIVLCSLNPAVRESFFSQIESARQT